MMPFLVGGILFYFKPKHRLSIGVSLIFFGVIELLFAFIEYWYPYGAGSYCGFGLLTILLGVICSLPQNVKQRQ